MRIGELIGNLLLATAIASTSSTRNITKADEPAPSQPIQTTSIKANNKPAISIENRTDSQIGKKWIITYTLKYNGHDRLILSPMYLAGRLTLLPLYIPEKKLTLYPKDVDFLYEGQLSNSAVPKHGIPRDVKISTNLRETRFPVVQLIDPDKEKISCHEDITITIKKIDRLQTGLERMRTNSSIPIVYSPLETLEPLELNQGDTFQVDIELDHIHNNNEAKYRYAPLLGNCEFDLQFGPHRIRDSVVLDKELSPVVILPKLNTPPKHFLAVYQGKDKYDYLADRTGDFLFIESSTPGFQYYLFDKMEIMGGDKLKLSFDYLIHPHTESHCLVELVEYAPKFNSWGKLNGGLKEFIWANQYLPCMVKGIDDADGDTPQFREARDMESLRLKRVKSQEKKGTWQHYETILQTRNEATILEMVFKAIGSDCGLFFIDTKTLKLEKIGN